jgi:N4-gp56 family major capsid protein
MADVITGTGSDFGAALVKTAYDRAVQLNLRSEPLIRAVADVRPVQQAMPGQSVVLTIYNDLTDKTTTLTETQDVETEALPKPATVTITLAEYGRSVQTTRPLEVEAFAPVDPAVANLIAYNMASSIDKVAEATLRGGTNVVRANNGTLHYNGGTTGGVKSSDTMEADHIRLAVTRLRSNLSPGRRGSLYHALVHPDVSYDLRKESGNGAWRIPHEYQDTANIYAGEIGTFEGAFFVEVYRSYVVGAQALAQAVGVEPNVVLGPVTDKLKRFQPIGWYALLGFARYHEASIVRIETASSAPAS